MENGFPILSWRRIFYNGKETQYIISDKGIVMNDATGEFLLVTPDKDNYPVVKLRIDGEDHVLKIHRLCCEAFNENPFDLPEVDHIDRNHWNSSSNNLEFVTGVENMRRLQKSREIEKNELCNYNSGSNHYSSTYTELQIIQVCIRLTKHERVCNISRKTKVDSRTIYLIKNGKIWKNISCYFSFNDDGIITDEIIDKIFRYSDKGCSVETIVELLKFPHKKYFLNIVSDIIKYRK